MCKAEIQRNEDSVLEQERSELFFDFKCLK